jgi:mono/diheme cytochrome c family protein
MKNTERGILLLAATLLLSTTAFSQPKSVDPGKQEFENSCGVCHGMDAKGSGFLTASLKVVPTDLTLLAKKNGGVFPVDSISRVIDGRTEIAAHGSRDMPIWGMRYAVNAAEHNFDAPYDQEAYIRNHILNLTDYLYRIQQK